VGALLVAMLLGPAPQAASRHELAQGLQRRIAEFEARHKAGKPPREKRALVTDAELTAYLNLLPKLPKSLSAIEVRFERERVHAKGLLDLDQLQDKLPPGSGLGLALFSGRVNVSVKGRLESEDGFGTFQPEDVRIGSIPLAPSVLEQIVASATRSTDHPDGIDILSPFRYPYGMRQIRLTPGRAVVEF
jgi:hypothetical protein